LAAFARTQSGLLALAPHPDRAAFLGSKPRCVERFALDLLCACPYPAGAAANAVIADMEDGKSMFKPATVMTDRRCRWREWQRRCGEHGRRWRRGYGGCWRRCRRHRRHGRLIPPR